MCSAMLCNLLDNPPRLSLPPTFRISLSRCQYACVQALQWALALQRDMLYAPWTSALLKQALAEELLVPSVDSQGNHSNIILFRGPRLKVCMLHMHIILHATIAHHSVQRPPLEGTHTPLESC